MSFKPGIRFFLWAAAGAFLAPPALGAEPAPLPLTRVRLYETGVGYFERKGPIGKGGVGLPVPAAHLDDALKTLVVLSDDTETRVSGVEFASSLSPGRARSLAGLPGPEDPSPLGLSALLRGLRGASVEVVTRGARATGRLVDVLDTTQSDLEACVRETAPAGDKPAPCTPKKFATLVLLGAGGEIRRLRVDDVESVRPTEPEYARRLSSALDAASDRNARAIQSLRVLAQAKKEVTLGYVAETPVFRASYRLVLPADSKPAEIQGWALLHNDTDEPWHAVRVELVNGRPDSFLFPLAAPRYTRRELLTPSEPLSTQPQLAGTTPDQLWGDEVGDAFGAGGIGLSGIGEGGGGRGEGIGLGNIGTLGHGAGTATGDEESSLVAVGNLAGISAATGVEVDALFRFTLAELVDLRAHGSLLAPFLGEAIDAQRIALFAASGGSARSAVRLVHRGSQTLPSGTIAVFADGGFAGEAVLARMKPGETQILEFGADPDVTLAEGKHRMKDETHLVAFDGSALVEHFVRHHELDYEIQNRSGTGREVSLALWFVNNSKVEGADSLVYDARSDHVLAVFSTPKKSAGARQLRVSEGLVLHHDVKTLTTALLKRITAEPALPAAQKKVLARALALAVERDAFARQRDGWKGALAQENAEVERLRGHARAVGADASEDIAERLLALEDEGKVVRRRVADLGAKSVERGRRLAGTLAQLTPRTP